MSGSSVSCHAEVWRHTFSPFIWLTGTGETNPRRMLAAQHAVRSQTRWCPSHGKLEQVEHAASHTLHTSLSFSLFLFFSFCGRLMLIPWTQRQATSCVCSCERASVLRHCGHRLQNSLVTKDKHGGNCWQELLSARRVPLKEKLIGHSGGREAVQGLLFFP